jgi:hypothetical protein
MAFGRFFCSASTNWEREKGNINADIADAVKSVKLLRPDQNRGRSSLSIVGPHDDAYGKLNNDFLQLCNVYLTVFLNSYLVGYTGLLPSFLILFYSCKNCITGNFV